MTSHTLLLFSPFVLTGYLSLHKNQLSGPLPENMNLRHLFYLDLSSNQFYGLIPRDWSVGPNRLTLMRHLYLDHNPKFLPFRRLNSKNLGFIFYSKKDPSFVSHASKESLQSQNNELNFGF